jgi:SAM-dependent methyltransferase
MTQEKIMSEAVSATITKLDFSYGDPIDGYPRYAGNLFQLPYDIPDNSVDEALSAYLMCRMDGFERARFMDEMYRILKPEAKLTVIVPYWSSARAIQDFTFKWPPMCEQSFLYFNKDWRTAQKIDNYLVKCDFDFGYGYTFDPDTAGRGDDTRPFWVKHYLNSVNDVQVVLTKKETK